MAQTINKINIPLSAFDQTTNNQLPIVSFPLPINITRFSIIIPAYGRAFSDGKKIGLRDAFRSIYCTVKYSLFSKNVLEQRKAKIDHSPLNIHDI